MWFALKKGKVALRLEKSDYLEQSSAWQMEMEIRLRRGLHLENSHQFQVWFRWPRMVLEGCLWALRGRPLEGDP